MNTTINIGILGLGYMGTTHLRAYQLAACAGFSCKVVAVCDADADRRQGIVERVGGNISDPVKDQLFHPAHVKGYADADSFLADPSIDLVSICTQTETHVDLATRALNSGKHVLLEKPVALTSADVRKVAAVAEASGRILMPAMCMRFWPAWSWLKSQIDTEAFGKCLSLSLQRLSGSPTWSHEFYNDPLRSGGAIIDMHIHDSDFVRFCFGNPQSVSSIGYKTGEAINHVTTRYHYPSGPRMVTAEGGWLSAGFGFRMRFIARFEHATADFDIGRTPQMVLSRDGSAEGVHVDPLSGYDHEIRHLLDAIAGKKSVSIASISDAVATARLLEAEVESVDTGRTVGVAGV